MSEPKEEDFQAMSQEEEDEREEYLTYSIYANPGPEEITWENTKKEKSHSSY